MFAWDKDERCSLLNHQVINRIRVSEPAPRAGGSGGTRSTSVPQSVLDKRAAQASGAAAASGSAAVRNSTDLPDAEGVAPLVQNALARSSRCGHPPPQRPTHRLLRAALWPPGARASSHGCRNRAALALSCSPMVAYFNAFDPLGGTQDAERPAGGAGWCGCLLAAAAGAAATAAVAKAAAAAAAHVPIHPSSVSPPLHPPPHSD